jgi:predicted transcriptional regulator
MQLLELLWDHDDAVTVRQVQLSIPELAYTTLMTTLDRLYRKGVLFRRLRGRAFAYQPRCSRHQMCEELVSSQVSDLLAETGARTAVLTTLIRAVSRRDIALLDELEVLVQSERKRIKSEDQ